MKTVIYTMNANNPDYAAYCLPTIERYAKKTNSDLIIMDESNMLSEYPNNHFLLYECYKHFDNSEYDRMLFLDVDILINPDAPNVFEEFPEGLWLRQGWEWDKVSDYAKQAFNDDVSDYSDRYYSCGFAVAGREEVSKLVSLFGTKPWVIGPWGGNQGQFNYFLSQTDININVLPIRWHFTRYWATIPSTHKFGDDPKAALRQAGCERLDEIYVIHYAGGDKVRQLTEDMIFEKWSPDKMHTKILILRDQWLRSSSGYLEREWLQSLYLPQLSGRILYIGINYYTSTYHTLVDDTATFDTLDICPERSKHGHSSHQHYNTDLVDFQPDFQYDHVSMHGCHGCVGHQINNDQIVRDIEKASSLVKVGGTFQFGPTCSRIENLNEHFWKEMVTTNTTFAKYTSLFSEAVEWTSEKNDYNYIWWGQKNQE